MTPGEGADTYGQKEHYVWRSLAGAHVDPEVLRTHIARQLRGNHGGHVAVAWSGFVVDKTHTNTHA